MHEMSLCESILEILELEAERRQFKTVKAVWLEIGDLSSVDPEAMRFSFDAVMQDSLAEGARLEIVAVRGRAWCLHCARNVFIQQRFDACPECGGFQLQVNDGEQMRIKELEVE
ncbi:MAG: hydrogenase maturation nickel metallochaperone HypA [Gammaproteobacteria bacterium]